MRSHSIARRVVTLFLLVEVLSALCMTGFVFIYERHTQFHSLDVSLRGHADTIMGAVTDADDTEDRVMLDLEGIQLPAQDRYEVWDNDANLLGRSPGWLAPAAVLHSAGDTSETTIEGVRYRAVRIAGVRRIDPAVHGVLHHVVVVYASPTLPVWVPVVHAVRAFALASLLLVGLSGLLVRLLVGRSMIPLHELALDASAISSSRWRFNPSPHAQHTRELAPLVTALQDLLQRLRFSFDQQRQFVSDSAHELKTAVTVVKSSLQLMQLRARVPDEYRDGVFASLNDCHRLEDLVQRMLTLARVEEVGSLARPGDGLPSDLAAGVLASFASIASVAQLRGVRLEHAGAQSLYATLAAEDWQTVCTNILFNSVQHSPPGTCVLVTLEQAGDRAICRIADQGPGIAPEALPFIFDRFFRSDTSRARTTGGVGLGLAICKALIERAGGRISAQSTYGRGATLSIDLPLALHTASPSLLSTREPACDRVRA